MKVLTDFVMALESYLGLKAEKMSLARLWDNNNGSGNGVGIQEYLHSVCARRHFVMNEYSIRLKVDRPSIPYFGKATTTHMHISGRTITINSTVHLT